MPRTAPQRSRAPSIALVVVALIQACSGDDTGARVGPNPATSATGGGRAGGGGGDGGRGAASAPSGPSCAAPEGSLPPLELTEVVGGLDNPVFVGSAPGDVGRLYVAERAGRIRIVQDGAILPTPFLDLSSLVSTCCKGMDHSFLGLAFHPGYAESGRFFVSYTKLGSPGDDTTVLAEYRRSAADPNVADPVATKVLLEIGQDHHWHYGGTIAFGKDGFLYVSRGDGGDDGDPENHAQSLQTKLGKFLRIDVDNHPTPPPGNLPGGDPDIWDIGVRNPWRWSFDACTGDLYFGDVGQDDREEIDVEPAGQGHNNYGWDFFEGNACYEGACDPSGLRMPSLEYTHVVGCAVIGGHVYRGSAIPALRGTYLYGDICEGRIATLVWSNGTVVSVGDLTDALKAQSVLSDHGLSSFGQDEAGEVYVVDLAGKIFRIAPAAGSTSP